VHYSAADADEQADHANCARRVRAIQDFHMDGRGWADIAYSYLACKHGFVYEGRGVGVRTAAQGTDAGNDGYHAVCFLGDDTPDRDDVTDAGRVAIRAAVEHCNRWAGVSAVRPHSWFKPTACPGDDLHGWLGRGMPIAQPAPPKEDDMTQAELLDALESDRGQAALRKAVTEVARAGFGGLHPDATGPQIRPSQAWLFDTVGEIHDAVVEPPPPA
jgi:hypothetical protein